MKGTKWLALLLALLLATGMTGCGAASTGAAANDAAAPQEMAYEQEALYDSVSTASGSTQETLTDQKLITRVNISAETEDLDALLESLNGQIGTLGGYIEYQDINNGSAYSSYRYRSASLTIRIPAEKLEGFVEQVKGASNVVYYNQSQENVTLTYVATESRMKALQTEETRLLELMEQAQTMSDLLEIEERLTEVCSDLESITSQLRVLENQVTYATIELSINQVKVYTEVEEQTVWQRISSGFSKNLSDLGEGIVEFFIWAVTYSPQLILTAAAAVAVILLLRRRLKKRRAKRSQMPPFEAPPKNPEDKQ